MFRQIFLLRSGNALQTIDEPGELDCVYKFLMYIKNHKETLGFLMVGILIHIQEVL